MSPSGLDEGIRCYAALPATRRLVTLYSREDLEGLRDYAVERLLPDRQRRARLALEVTPNLRPDLVRDVTIAPEKSASVSVPLRVDGETWGLIRDAAANPSRDVLGVGVDIRADVARSWVPASGGPFSDRVAAERLIGCPTLRKAGLKGSGVNLAIFDTGLDATRLGTSYGGGMGATAGAAAGGHGMDTARQILAVAPDAILYDYPVLPPRITSLPAFLSQIDMAYRQFALDIAGHAQAGRTGPWVAVNAWAIFDCRPGTLAYADLNSPAHPIGALLDASSKSGIDVVFAAGNCGQFAPDPRCGEGNREPGASILGPSSSPNVLSVGGVRADGIWAGFSSQGVGQPLLADKKPDLCGPTDFVEMEDARIVNSGTSTACGLAAGILAALRGAFPGPAPAEMRDILRGQARRDGAPGWDLRTGYGILDGAAAMRELARRYP